MSQHSPIQFSSQEQINDTEISLINILIFLKRSYKLIALIGLLGVATSFGYLLITPKKYQASAQIQMAQIVVANNSSSNVNPLGINIEEPSLLIARLSSPTSYSAEVIEACGLGSEKNAQFILSKSVKLILPKGVPNIVDMRIIGTSSKNTVVCAQAVFSLIKATQAQIVKPYIEVANAKLLDNQERIAKLKDLVARADKAGSAMDVAYLSMRDEIRFLLDEINTLTNVVSSSENMATRLVAPIYGSDDPITPKNGAVLLAGLFGGLFLGLLIAFGRRLIPNIKAQLENNAQSK
jgi:LPS O-antigen subunit length determinant protein (WzzB/FepE family)